jgi:extracellular factor (EF) 3-hydroxypalmitic acid methyl ester biosynthesis protein
LLFLRKKGSESSRNSYIEVLNPTTFRVENTFAGIDSLVAFTNTSGVKGRGTLVHISRAVAVFEVYNPFSLIQLSEVLQELTVLRGERMIYRGKGVVTSLVTTGLMVIVSVTLIDPWSDLDHLQPGPALGTEIERFIQEWEVGLALSESYQLSVNRFASFLAETNRWIEEAATAVIGNSGPDEEKGVLFREAIEAPFASKLRALIGLFEEEAGKISPDEAAAYKAFARRQLHSFILCAPFVWRSFTKPLGYAGDYEMVNMMLRESPTVGSTTYARILHGLTTGVAACLAHRNRITILERLLSEEAERVTEEQRIFTVLSVACGPAVEIQRFLRNQELADHCAVHLMDFNEETLAYVQNRVEMAVSESGRKPTVKFIRKSIDDLLKNIHLEHEGFLPAYDMIYCAGLFDYFPDNVCRNLLHLYFQWLRPGGLLVATNVHPKNPERNFMEHLLDWYLVYRNEAEMGKLAPKDADKQVFVDETGVNVFLSIRKPA